MASGRDIDEIGGDRRGGRLGAGAAPFEHDPSDEIALGDDCVEYPLDRGDRGSRRHHARMNALFEPVLGQPGDPEELDAEAQLVREADIEPRYVTDALGINAVGVDRSAEGEARQDRQLVRGIDAVDVEARISLGITELLRLGQHLGEFAPALAHRRQDVVRCAVEDAVNPRHAVAGKALAQCLDDRDPAGDGGLEGERDAGLLGAPGKAQSVLGDQRLIGGDDVLAASQRGLDDIERDSIGAANQLDDRIDFRIGRHGGGVLVPAHRR